MIYAVSGPIYFKILPSKHMTLRTTAALIVSAACMVAPAPVSANTLDWGDGVNIQAGFFNNADKGNIPLGWGLMRRFDQIKTVRIEIAPDEGVSLLTMQRWIHEADQNGYKVIATYHRYQDNGSGDPEAVMKAARWWKANYKALSGAGPFTINVINEWGSHRTTSEEFADTYNKAIAIIREFYKGPIVVDIPGWGQETVVGAKASPLIKDGNVVLSIHIYGSAYIEQGAHHWMAPEDLVEFAKVGRPVLIGEFGGMREGGADWRALVAQAKALGWTVLAWAWNGDGEGMNMVLPSWNDEHSPKSYFPDAYFGDVYAYIGKTPDPQMTLSVQGGTITLGDWAQNYTFAVHSNAAWAVTVNGGEGWVTSMNPSTCWGTKTVIFSVTGNTTGLHREAWVTVKCGDKTLMFAIHQNPHTPVAELAK
jgi:mannan endo-1,4-beta-mannosidase